MYYNKTRAECTSSAALWQTVFKSLGIPTRMSLGSPLLCGGEEDQVNMVLTNI